MQARGDVRHPNRGAGEALWRFSLALYSLPRVAEALLRLQDRAGCDVNLILFALWAGAVCRCSLGAADLAAASAASAPVGRGMTTPLRQLRGQLKTARDGDLQALRRRLLALELASERAVQQRLAASPCLAPDSPAQDDPLLAAEANLALYLGGESASSEAAIVRSALRALMRRG